jgi:L-lysine 2,3-aminomutase
VKENSNGTDINVGTIEEDIKILKKLISAMKSDRELFTEKTDKEIYTFFINALEHILSDYKRVLKELEEKTTILLAGAEKVKQLEKENEELNLKYHMLYTEKIDKQKAQEVKIKSQVIPIQKVKDKISERQFELQQEYKDFEDDSILIALQELLEGRK